MKRVVVMSAVFAALALTPAALANGSTMLEGYGTSGSKPVVQVKGTSQTITPAAQPVSNVTAASAASAASSPAPATLPFTGSDLLLFAVAGVALLGIGLGLRRVGRDRS